MIQFIHGIDTIEEVQGYLKIATENITTGFITSWNSNGSSISAQMGGSPSDVREACIKFLREEGIGTKKLNRTKAYFGS